jgi:hypothetical protein
MNSISKFDVEIYSEELYNVTEAEYDEVMGASGVEDEDWQCYEEWSRDNEETTCRGSKLTNGVLIQRACDYPGCPHTRCAKAVRIGGTEK